MKPHNIKKLKYLILVLVLSLFINQFSVLVFAETDTEPNIYIVKKGDKPSKIAELYGIDSRELYRLNKEKNPSKKIHVGQELIVPKVNTKYTNYYGNTAANIQNYGIVTQQGDWIYYTKNNKNNNICKIKKDGTEDTVIFKNIAYKTFLNAVGDWLYYCTSIGIYKMRIDGTYSKKISDVQNIRDVIVAGKYIYYTVTIPGTIDGPLYRIRTDGTDLLQITDDKCAYINIVDDWIYYRNSGPGEEFSESILCRIRIDGTQKEYLHSGEFNYGAINVVGNSIYFIDNWIEMKKININKPKQIISFGKRTSNLCVFDGWIYYQAFNEQNEIYGIYKMKTNGKDNTLLLEGSYAQVNIVDGWLYYLTMSTGIRGKIKLDGTDLQHDI